MRWVTVRLIDPVGTSNGCNAVQAAVTLFCLHYQVTRQLRTDGWPALSIHGDKSQQERDWVLNVSPSKPLSSFAMPRAPCQAACTVEWS